MKTLNTSKLSLVVLRSGLKQVSPQDVTMGEIELIVGKILPLVNGAIPEEVKQYDEANKELAKMRKDLSAQKINQQDAVKISEEINDPILKWEEGDGKAKVEVNIEDKDYDELVALIDKFGKNWFNNIEKYFEFHNDLKSVTSA